MPDNIQEIKDLEKIDLDQNQFSEIPIPLSKIEFLNGISIQKNNVRNLPLWLLDLMCLKDLHLAGNSLLLTKTNIEILENYDKRVVVLQE